MVDGEQRREGGFDAVWLRTNSHGAISTGISAKDAWSLGVWMIRGRGHRRGSRLLWATGVTLTLHR